MKKALLIISVLLVSILLVGCGKHFDYISNENNQGKEVKSDLIVKDRNVDVFQFTNASLVVNDNSSNFKVLMTNTSEDDALIKKVIISFYDENNNLIATMEGAVLGTVEAKETKTLSASHYEKLDNAYSLSYEIVK